MSGKLNWHNLRPWSGSQHSAFEQLCCQLAACEPMPQDAAFIRKGTPDAGVECYWVMPNGDEWGLQAKFFDKLEQTQWTQLDKSVETALIKHPRLKTYVISIPLDRPDARIDNKKSLMDKWNERVERWKQIARKQEISIQFKYWGEYEIFERLSREEHRGRLLFWFDRETFSDEWFANRIEEATNNSGPRYTPDLNLELPISNLFRGLGRTDKFLNELTKLNRRIQVSIRDLKIEQEDTKIQELITQLRDSIQILDLELNHFQRFTLKPISISILKEQTHSAIEVSSRLEIYLKRFRKEKRREQKLLADSSLPDYRFVELKRFLAALNTFIYSKEVKLANNPTLLLLGKAGTGKTHLFCDVCNHRIHENLPTILLLGQQFGQREPWTQILELLDLSCDKEEFLGALEAAANAHQCKALICIDALNEGEGKKIWKNHLAGFLTTLQRFPSIAVAISVRTPFKEQVIPAHIELVSEEHTGFTDHEYEATRAFFEYYHLKRPSFPLINPEFSNPLFLKLFCISLKNQGITKFPSGFMGITSIFENLFDSVNYKLSSEDYLDYDIRSQVVQKSMSALAERMAHSHKQWVELETAKQIVGQVFPSHGYHKSLYKYLLTEGLLSEDYVWQESNGRKKINVIRFTYERFSDHLIIRYLLDQNFDLQKYFSIDSLNSDSNNRYKAYSILQSNHGLFQALAIQLPEFCGKEIFDVFPRLCNLNVGRDAFLQSIIWRNPSLITKTTKKYIDAHFLKNNFFADELLEVLLTIATNPCHPYNSEFLHQALWNFSLADRDAYWSTFIFFEYESKKATDRLVEWASSRENKDHISDEPIKLAGITLIWFLCSSNRFLRDRTTKALVNLLTPRLHILENLIQKFIEVNDTYIQERLMAVSYGCVMRSTDLDGMGQLAKTIFQLVFQGGTPLPHLLFRDYARGVIETAIVKTPDLDLDVGYIRPPYISQWPEKIPDEAAITQLEQEMREKTGMSRCNDTDELQEYHSYDQCGLSIIKSSVMG